jgi:hypothetical protein
MLYCLQCHGALGGGDGPASIASKGGYIQPQPANFTESGEDFQVYGRYVYKVLEGVETTNMPPWKYALSSEEIYQVVFYVQNFSSVDDYNTKWGPMYNDSFAHNLKGGLNSTAQMTLPASATSASTPSQLISLLPATIATSATGFILWQAGSGSAGTGRFKFFGRRKEHIEDGHK